MSLLDITLTQRSQSADALVVMAGVQFHAFRSYLVKLIRLDGSVAICEQAVDVAGEGPVERQGVRVVTLNDLVQRRDPI